MTEEQEEIPLPKLMEAILPYQEGIYVTVLNIIQCLVVWHRYISESQYLWPMSWWDTLIPFMVGVVEWLIVFSVSDKVSIFWFVFSMFLLHVLVLFGYAYAYAKRKKGVTEKLYADFYKDYPSFRDGLLNFLTEYDKWHIKVYIVVPLMTLTFLVLIGLFPNRYNGIIFPAFYLFEAIRGEYFNNFQKALRRDKNIGHYFQ